LAFKVYLDASLTPSDMANITVNAAAPAGPDGAGAYWYNFTTPALDNGTWDFTISNGNAFNVSGLNYSAIVWFQRELMDVSLDIGDDGTIDWSLPGMFSGNHSVTLSGALLASAPKGAPPTTDKYGNDMCTVPLTFSASGYGMLSISNLSVPYNYTAHVADFYGSLTMFLQNKPHGNVTVPITVKADGAGGLRLSGLHVVSDVAPVLVAPIPSTYSITEEGFNDTLIDLSQYFTDDTDTRLNYSLFDNTNSSYVRVTINGTYLGARALVVNWSGTTTLEVNASDSSHQKTPSNKFTITVAAVNDAPVIISIPPASGEVNVNWTYQVNALDSDDRNLTYILEEAPYGMGVNLSGFITWRPVASALAQPNNVTINVSDGKLSAVQRFHVNVTTRNTAPRITPKVNATAYVGKFYSTQMQATDAENDRLTWSLDRMPTGMTIDPATGLINWTTPLEGNATILVNVTDGISYSGYTFVLKVLRNNAPKITSGAPLKAKVGDSYTYKVTASDIDGQVLSYSLDAPPEGMSISLTGVITWTPKDNQKGNNHVVVAVTDGADTVRQSFDVEVSEKGLMGGGMEWLIIVLVIVIIAVVAGVAIMMMRRKKKVQTLPAMPEEGPETAPSKPEAIISPGAPTQIDDIFVTYKDGRLIHHLSNSLKPVDNEIFASMFSAIQDFMKTSMGAEKVDSINYGEKKILIEKGRLISIAVSVNGQELPEMRQKMKNSISDIEMQSGQSLEKWDGEAEPLKKDIALLVKPISDIPKFTRRDGKQRDKNPEEYVTLLSGLEFYRGYVRMKIAVQNDLGAVITDSSIKLILKQEALKISHIEPDEYLLSGDEIAIGNVQPEEKVTVAVYLDPMICTTSFIDATLTFKDSKGKLFSIVMARKKADIVCPMFHTDEEINVAMLRKMITEFQQHDSKVFNIPNGLGAEDAFGVGKAVIESHNVRLIREYSEQKPAYMGEAWYYGKTQIKKDQVVMRISVTRESNTLEFFVGSSDLAAITGLLAEFGHELNRKLKEKGIIQGTISHLDLTEKDRVARKSTLLLHRYSEAEAGAGENEPRK